MEIAYPRLYLRMALYIGASLAGFVLVGALILFLIASYELQGYVAARQGTLGQEAALALESGGRAELKRWLSEDADIPPDVSIYILDQSGSDLFGRQIPVEMRGFIAEFVIGDKTGPNDNFRPLRLAPQLIGPDGEVYSFLPIPNNIGLRGSPAITISLIAVAVLVIVFVAWLIASRFGRPIGELQEAVRELASGHIDARVPAAISNRPDELGALAADFNTMADQLQRLIDSREQLMQEMSHELRSPLARLQASLALAAHHHRLEPTETERIEREIRAIDRTIGEMLRFSRLEAPATIPPRLARIGTLLRELVDVEDVEAQARNCRLALKADSNLPVIGNIDLLRSGFENVVRNAIRYAPPGSEVDITARRRGKHIEVRIGDRGPGVPEDALERIFEPFYRAKHDNADTDGTGLGLAIARRAFTAFGGDVSAAIRTGGGLEITVRLPAADLD